jgi:hypothetical protein
MPQHHFGVIDAVHVPCLASSTAQLGERDTWTEADLENPVSRLHIEQ